MAIAVARAMPSEAPSLPLTANEDPAKPAATTAAMPTDVGTIARLARMARTRALTQAPTSKSATTTCAASGAEPKIVEKNDLS